MADVEALPNRAEWHYNQGKGLLDAVVTHKDEDNFTYDSAQLLVASAQAHFTAGLLADRLDSGGD